MSRVSLHDDVDSRGFSNGAAFVGLWTVDAVLALVLMAVLHLSFWDATHATRALAIPPLLVLGGGLYLWILTRGELDRPSRALVAVSGGVLGAVLIATTVALLDALYLGLLMLMFSGSTGSGGSP